MMDVDDCAQVDGLSLSQTAEILGQRYKETDKDRDGSHSIYTWVGTLLLAMNPQIPRPKFYSDQVKAFYRDNRSSKPHVFALAQRLLDSLYQPRSDETRHGDTATRHGDTATRHRVTAILSGDSGSGKTETCRLIANYMSWLSSSGSGIEARLSCSGIVLECLGNAQTISNTNSSRFGKLTSIYLDTSKRPPQMKAARIQTYLLAKSRVAHLRSREQNFHAFYTLLADANRTIRPKPYDILRPNTNNDTHKKAVVAFPMETVTQALTTCGMSSGDQEFIWSTLSSLLILGNVAFESSGVMDGVRVVTDLSAVADQWGVGEDDLKRILTSVSVRDQRRLFNLNEAVKARDALIKSIYASLFEWVVPKMNESLQGTETETESGKWKAVELLDIYGFEVEPENGFEQLLINTANEKLQRFFVDHLALNEWALFQSEGLVGDNAKAKDIGDMCQETRTHIAERLSTLHRILLTLHDKSYAPIPNHTRDASFTKAVSTILNTKTTPTESFRFNHFAASLVYQTEGFCEANRDVLSADGCRLVESSNLRCKDYLPRLSSQYKSVGLEFSAKVDQLISHMKASPTVHFIRCLRANREGSAGTFDKGVVSLQLQHGGIMNVLECLRVNGFPCRVSKSLLHSRVSSQLDAVSVSFLSDERDLLRMTLLLSGLSDDDYKIGLTKIFFRQLGFTRLQQTIFAPHFWETVDAPTVRRLWREKILPVKWRRVSRSLVFVCRLRRLLRRRRAASVIQRRLRMHFAQKELQRRRNAVLALQRTWRRITFTRALLATPATVAGQELTSYPSSDNSRNETETPLSLIEETHLTLPEETLSDPGEETAQTLQAAVARVEETAGERETRSKETTHSSPMAGRGGRQRDRGGEQRQRRYASRNKRGGKGQVSNGAVEEIGDMRRNVYHKRRLNRKMRQYDHMRSRSVAPERDMYHIQRGVSPPCYRTRCDEWFQPERNEGRRKGIKDQVAAVVQIVDDTLPAVPNRRRRSRRSPLAI